MRSDLYIVPFNRKRTKIASNIAAVKNTTVAGNE